MNSRQRSFIIYLLAALSLGLLSRPLIDELLFQNPLHPKEMTGKYLALNPPGHETYELLANGSVECTSYAPLNPYPDKSLGLWQMVEPNICFITLRRTHPVVGPTYQSIYLRTDLNRSDVVFSLNWKTPERPRGLNDAHR